MLSTTAKESIKTALAVTAAYAIALSMNWDKPVWAALAVAACSAAMPLGASLTKAVHRTLGTALAIGVALLILSLTIQDRWWFMVALSAWLAFCAYKLVGSRVSYAWQVAGFVTAIIAIDASGIPEKAFTTAVLRAQETALGIVVYSLVSVFIWPVRSKAQLDEITRARAGTQRELFQACRRLLGAGEGDDDVKRLRPLLLQQQHQFDQLLDAASADTPEVAETVGQWRRYQREAAALGEALVRWQEGFGELRALDLPRLVPGLAAYDDEIERRLGDIERMLGGQPPEHAPEDVDLSLAPGARQGLKPFDTAALAVARSRLDRIDSSTRSLFGLAADLEGFAGRAADAPADTPTAVAPAVPWFMFDPESLSGAVRVMVALWLAYLVYLYVPDVPGGTLIVVLTGSVVMAAASMPQVPMTMTFRPVFWSISFAAVIHLLVMWRLETFLGLAPLIFVAVFAICYLFSDPRHALNRAIALPVFFVIASIDNEQTYSFLLVANIALGAFLSVLVVMASAYVPRLPLAERAFLRLSRRFFRSCAWLVSDMSAGAAHGRARLRRSRRAYHLREVRTLPAKLAAWARFIDPRALPGTTPAQVTAVVTTLDDLMGRLHELREVRGHTQMLQLSDEIETWRRELEAVFRRLSERPDAVDGEALRAALDGFLVRLETRVREVIAGPDASPLTADEATDFYRLLGAHRSVSEALVDYARAAGAIDWSPWREARFA